MNELQSRGVEDILIFAGDNLSGISDAIEAVFLKAEIQKCIVHQIRGLFAVRPLEGAEDSCGGFKKDIHRLKRGDRYAGPGATLRGVGS